MKAVKVQGDTEKKDLTYIIARVRNYYVIYVVQVWKKGIWNSSFAKKKKKKRNRIDFFKTRVNYHSILIFFHVINP